VIDMKKFFTLVILIFLLFLTGCNKSTSTYEDYVKMINQNFDVDVYLLGDDLNFEYSFEYTLINSLSSCDSTAEYKYIIINEKTGYSNLSHVNFADLEYLSKEENYKIIYVNIKNYSSTITSSGYEIYYSEDILEGIGLYLYDAELESTFSSDDFKEFYIVDFIRRDLMALLDS